MATASIDIKILTISEDELRKIIREEVSKLVEPGAQRPEYLPPVSPYRQQDQWWQAPVVTCGSQVADNTGVSFNGDTPRWADDVLDGPGSSTR